MTTPLAYLDGGSAALVLQMVAGAAAALAVTIKVYGRRIKRFVFRTGADDAGSGTISQRDTR